MPPSRLARVEELLKEEIGRIIDRLEDPRIPPFVTVHSVKVTRDLRTAQVFVTLLNDDDERKVKEAVAELNHAAAFIRSSVGRSVTLRYLPVLHFHYNPSTRYAATLETVFHKLEAQQPKPLKEPTKALDKKTQSELE